MNDKVYHRIRCAHLPQKITMHKIFHFHIWTFVLWENFDDCERGGSKLKYYQYQ